MIWYSFGESLASIISAVVYGGIFSIFCMMAKTVISLFKMGYKIFLSILFYQGSPFEMPAIDAYDDEETKRAGALGEIIAAVKAVLFSMGLTIVLYYTLDGMIRAFVVLAALISLLIVSRFFSPKIGKWLFLLLSFVLRLSVPVFRLLIYPIRAFFQHLYLKSGEKWHIWRIFNRFSGNLTIDSRNQ